MAMLCKFCVESINKRKIPKYSLAEGFDYGDIDRVPDHEVFYY